MKLTKTGETSGKIMFTYDKPPGDVRGYLYYADGKQVAKTFDPNDLTVTFGKVASGKYAVEAISFGVIARAEYPEATTPPPTGPPAPTGFKTTNVTQTTVDLAWDAMAGVANYRIYRDNSLIGQGAGSAGGFTDTWSDSGLTPATKYVYAIEAIDSQGVTSQKSTLSVTTAVQTTTPPPTGGNVVKISGTVTSAALNQQIAAAPAGAVIVQPADGQATYTVSDDIRLARNDVTFYKGTFKNVIADGKGNNFVFDSCTVHAFGLRNVSGWTIKNCVCPFNDTGWNSPEFGPLGGSVMAGGVKNWKILDTAFSGHYVASNPSQHTEAWYIGGGNSDGLISGCTFDNGGTTGHLFWTWWFGSQTDQSTWPKNICVTKCKFTRCRNPYFHTQIHEDIQNGNLNLRLDTSTCTFDSSANEPMGNQFGTVTKFLAPCTAA